MTDQSHSNINEERQAIRRLAQRLAAQSNASSEAKKQTADASNADSEQGAQGSQAAQGALNAQAQANANAQAQAKVEAQSQANAQLEAAQADAYDQEPDSLLSQQQQPIQDQNALLKACYQRNMAAFFKYDPNIYQKFCSYRPSQPLEILYTKSGTPDVYFPKKHEFFYKTDDPLDLCYRQVDVVLKTCPFQQVYYNLGEEDLGQIHHRYIREMSRYQSAHIPDNGNPLLASSCPTAIILGVGLGYHIGKLYESIEIGNLIIIEPNPDLFYASLYTFDWANLLEFIVKENRGLYLMVGQSKDQVFNDLNEFYCRHGHMLAGFMWTMIHYRSTEITAIADQLSVDYDRSYASIGFLDDSYFCISHASYLITHHARFFRNDVVLPEDIRDIPFCVVANGPSLSKDLPFLRKIQDKVLILACGSAIETLYNAGIQPFFYAATERLKIVAESLTIIPDQDFVKNCILVSSDVCHPATFNMFKYTALFTKSDEVFFGMAGLKFFEKYRPMQGACMINPLVGNLGVVTGGLLRFKQVYLFGMDNGTKHLGELHPEESILYKNMAEREKEENKGPELGFDGKPIPSMHELSFTFPGNFDGTVHSSYLYKIALRYIELMIDSAPQSKYFNCSDGAKITGAAPVHSETLLESWEKLPDVDFTRVRDFIEQEKTYDLDIKEEELESIVDHEAFYHVVDVMKKVLTSGEKPKSRLEFVFLLERACETLYSFKSRRYNFAIQILNGSLNQFYMMIIRVLYLTADEKEAIARAEKHMGWVIDFLDDARALYKFVPYYYAEDHKQYFNGKIGYDHPDSKAPPIRNRAPLVTDEDRANYPIRKFVKRYE